MVIFVLRHADRSPTLSDGLSPAGVKRAQFLSRMLKESGISVAYCSDASRTHETLVLSKQALGGALTVKEVSAAPPGGPDAHVEAVVAALRQLPASTVAAAVSHSNTVGPIIEALGGESIAPILENEFDKLFVLFGTPDGPKTLLRLRY
jgi:phosphohistidine phosphatase SixA